MTLDGLDLRTQRDGARRHIAYEGLQDVTDARVRRIVGAEWLGRMKQEHLAVGAFALLASELAAEGCEPVVLSLVARAAADEVRHADVCRSLALAFLDGAGVPRAYRGVPIVPAHSEASSSERVLFHVVEMCCLSETFTGIYFTEVLSRVTHPTMRAAFESLLEDEIDHGRVGWAYLASRARSGRTAGLSAAVPAMLDRVVGRVLDRARKSPEPDDAALVALGTLGNDAGAAIFKRGLRDVVLPGFETLGIDLGPARERIDACGYLT